MANLHRLIQYPPIRAAFISGAVFLAIIVLLHSGSIEPIELMAYDWFIQLQPKLSASLPRVALIGITDKDIKDYGLWPLTDAKMAEVLSIINRQKPRAIGMDIYRDIPVQPGHEELNSLLTENPHIIAVKKFGDDGIPPPPVLQETEQVGFNDLLVDPGGTVRRGLLFLDDGNEVACSFALRLATLYLQKEGITPVPDTVQPSHMRLGKNTIKPFESDEGGYIRADAHGYQFLLDFKESIDFFPIFSITRVLTDDIPHEELRDRVVLIGTTGQSVKDVFYTPYSRGLEPDQQIPGIAVHAHIISQLIRLGLGESSPIKTLGGGAKLLWVFLWCFCGGLVSLRVRSAWGFSIAVSSGLVALGFMAFSAFLLAWWIPLVPPAMGWFGSAAVATAYMFSQERKERAFLMQIFSRHVSSTLAENIWRHRDQFVDGGRPRSQKLVATVLFCDLKGFTPVAERMDPQTLTDWLNTYMERMAHLIMEHGGVVDDYAGDGIKADFGVPLARTSQEEIGRDAVKAVECALAMEKEMHSINSHWKNQGYPTAGLRVGINTGPVVAGTFGSAQRLKYTTIGNIVNIASRLESYDKDSMGMDPVKNPCRILMGEATLSYLGDQFLTMKVGDVNLRGQTEIVGVYRVVARRKENAGDDLEEKGK